MLPILPATHAAFASLEMRFSWSPALSGDKQSPGVWGTGVRLRRHINFLHTAAQRAVQLCLSAALLPAVAILSGQIASCHCPAGCSVGFLPRRSSANLVAAQFIHCSVSVREYDLHWRCSDWFWVFPPLTVKFSLPFLPSSSSSCRHCCLNDVSSCKESDFSSPQGTQRSPCPNSSWNRWGKTRTQATHSQSSGLSRWSTML